MKKIFTLLILWATIGASSAMAQEIVFLSDEAGAFGEMTEATIDVKNYVVYTGNKEATFNWSWTGSVPEGWGVGVCTSVCYTTPQSIVPETMAPGDTLEVKLQFSPNGEIGDADIELIFEKTDDASISATTRYLASSTAVSVDKIDTEAPFFNAYPNPARNTLNVELVNIEGAKWAKIYNLLGQELKAVELDEMTDVSIKIDVADLREGFYLITIEEANGQPIEAHRFSKIQ